MELGTPELLIVLVVIILLFGPGRISLLAKELGEGIKNFRKELGVKDAGIEQKPSDQH